MSTNVTAFIKRWTVETTDQLKSGPYMLQCGQWGFARVDERAVMRDNVGNFHELLAPSSAYPYMDTLILPHDPVFAYADLTTTDLPGTIRLVSNELAVYVYTGTEWVKQPFESVYADFIGIGAIDVVITPVGKQGEVPLGVISHKADDGNRHIPSTKASITPAPVIIDGVTYQTVNIGGRTWIKRDLHAISGLAGGLGTRSGAPNAGLFNFSFMDALDSLNSDWRLPTISEWKDLGAQTSHRPQDDAFPYGAYSECDVSRAWNDDYLKVAGSAWGDSQGWGRTGESGLDVYPYTYMRITEARYMTSSRVPMRWHLSGTPATSYVLYDYPGFETTANWHSLRKMYSVVAFTTGYNTTYGSISGWREGHSGVYRTAYAPPSNHVVDNRPPDGLYAVRLVRKRYDTGTNDGKCLIAKTDLVGSEKWDYPNMDMIAQGDDSKKLSAAEYTDLTDSGDSSAHHHVSDGGYSVDVIYTMDFSFIHGLGRKPSVELVDTSGRQIWVDIDYPDDNTVHINCNQPFTGSMRIS